MLPNLMYVIDEGAEIPEVIKSLEETGQTYLIHLVILLPRGKSSVDNQLLVSIFSNYALSVIRLKSNNYLLKYGPIRFFNYFVNRLVRFEQLGELLDKIYRFIIETEVNIFMFYNSILKPRKKPKIIRRVQNLNCTFVHYGNAAFAKNTLIGVISKRIIKMNQLSTN